MLPTIKHNDYLLTLKINNIKKNNVVVASSGDKKFPLNTNINRAFLIYRYPFNFEIL